MGKVKDFFDEQRRDYLAILKRYTVTIVIGMITSVVYIIMDQSDHSDEDIFIILFMSMLAAFYIETVWKAKGKSFDKLLIGYVVGIIIAIGWDVLSNVLIDKELMVEAALEGNMASIGQMKAEYYLATLAALYMMILGGLAIFQLVKESKATFPEYMVRLVISACKFLSIFLILNIGALLLIGIFDALILNINDWRIFAHAEVLLCGFVYLPFGLICLSEQEQEKTKFVRGLICYAMMPIILAATALIYLYILKVVFISGMPSNEVFTICASLFCFGVCVWTAAYAYRDPTKEEGLYDKIIKYMKYIYAPLLLLEIYAVGVRVADYGLTEDRVMGVWFIIAQVIYIAWEPILTVVRKCTGGEKPKLHEGYEGLIFAGIILYFLAAICPLTNVERLVCQSQKGRFERAYAAESYSEAKQAYNTLNRNIYGRSYLNERSDIDEIKNILSVSDPYEKPGYGSGDKDVWEYATAYTDSDKQAIPINGAKYLYEIEDYGSYDDIYGETMLAQYEISYPGGYVTADLTGLVKEMIKAPDKMLLPYSVSTTGGTLVVKSIHFNFQKDELKVKGITLLGYLLTY